MNQLHPIIQDDLVASYLSENEPEVIKRSIDTVHVLHTTRLSNLQNKATKESSQLKNRHHRVVFLHKMQKALGSAADENGNIDFAKYPALQKMREEGMKMKEEADKIKIQIQELEREGKQTEAKELRQEMDEIYEVVDAMDASKTKTTYTKEEKNTLIEKIRLTCEDFNMYIQMQTQAINRLHNEYNLENLRLGDMMKRDDAIIRKIIQGFQAR